MKLSWIIAIVLTVIFTILFWNLSKAYYKKEYGAKVWQQWVSRLFYWQAIIYAGAATAYLIMVLLRKTNILTF